MKSDPKLTVGETVELPVDELFPGIERSTEASVGTFRIKSITPNSITLESVHAGSKP